MGNKLTFNPETGDLIRVEKIKSASKPFIIIRQIPYIILFASFMVYLVPVLWPGLCSFWPFLDNMFMFTKRQFPLMGEYITDPEKLTSGISFFRLCLYLPWHI